MKKVTRTQSIVDDRPHVVVLEQVHGDVLADSDVDELVGRVDEVEDGGLESISAVIY
jgi:hypothetical protein